MLHCGSAGVTGSRGMRSPAMCQHHCSSTATGLPCTARRAVIPKVCSCTTTLYDVELKLLLKSQQWWASWAEVVLFSWSPEG
jgi:hypothetical protein